MQNTLSIRYAFYACARGVPCYLEPSIVFKAKVARHVIIHYIVIVKCNNKCMLFKMSLQV